MTGIQEARVESERAECALSLTECLRAGELFAGLSDDILERIAALCQEETYCPGAAIFSEGDEAQKLYILQEGVVALRVQPASGAKSIVVQPIEKRCGIFGWSGMVEPNIYTASAVCATDVKVIAVDGKKLMAVFEDFPAAGLVVMRRLATVIGSRLRTAWEHVMTDVYLASQRF
jgi:CRP/FNR family cyclic AMP-dependent transcriptional regulator